MLTLANDDKKEPEKILAQIKSLLLIGAGVTISTANTPIKDLVGGGIKVFALAFICWCLFTVYKNSRELAKLASENRPS